MLSTCHPRNEQQSKYFISKKSKDFTVKNKHTWLHNTKKAIHGM